ncbi:MAG: 4Fe-4S binding protein [Desulfobulbaceae bacterium]|nr:4Fe-4S binding protein [Desulfobulbaceae bacterium]
MAEQKRKKYSPWRLLSLFLAFLVILVNPFLNFYLGINFIQGWYQSLGVGNLWFVSPLEGLESLLVTRRLFLPSLIGMAIPILLALFLGRVFCSWVCPINFFGELLDRIRKAISRKKYIRDRLVLARTMLWYTLITELLLTMILGAPIFVFMSPPGLVGREIMMAVFFHKLALEGVVVLLVLLLELVTRRFYCRYFCPLGALLAFIGMRRKLVVQHDGETCVECGLCDKACPLGLAPSLGESTSVYCWNCGSCIDSCQSDALVFSWKKKPSRYPIEVS